MPVFFFIVSILTLQMKGISRNLCCNV